MDHEVVAIIGGGVMGETIMRSVLAGGVAPGEVLVAEPRAARAAQLAEELGLSVATSAAAAAREATTVVIAVKPQDVAGVLAEIAPVADSDTLVASVAVGLPCSFYEQRLPDAVPVVRIMPNTPAVVGAGVSAISAGIHATDRHLATVERLLAATGTVVRVPEKQQDAVGALSGSGPAYVFYVIDALAEGGVMLGLPRDLATRLAVETVGGAAQMVAQTGEHPVVLRERVSSPGGTTVAALRQLDQAGVRAAFLAAMEAAMVRTRELAAEMS